MTNFFQGKTILVTGGTGSIGSILVENLLEYSPKQVRVLSRDESRQYYLLEKLNNDKRLRFLIGDIRDRDRLDMAVRDVDIIFHAAALKHVPLCEYNPFEAVKTNIIGSQNIIDAALEHNIDTVIAISTDKAVNPNNIMGTSKLMMEKLFINANFYRGKARTKFSCVRFGNVMWARGSVMPLWKKQVERNNQINITNNAMTRFFMSIDQAIKLIFKATTLAHGGEIFILKMPSVKISDLAKLFINKYFPDKKIKIKMVGLRPGEKLHEDLFVNNTTSGQIFESTEMIIVVPELFIYNLDQPKFQYPKFVKRSNLKEINSKKFIKLNEIRKII